MLDSSLINSVLKKKLELRRKIGKAYSGLVQVFLILYNAESKSFFPVRFWTHHIEDSITEQKKSHTCVIV